jgi:predicted alpha/beta-fold hydrolase
VIPIGDFRALELPPNVELDIATHGGHCAFIRDFSLRSFTEDYIAERMLAHAVANAAEPPLRGSVAA